MILVHLSYVLHEGHTHILLHFKHPVQLLTPRLRCRDQGTYLKPIERRTDVVIVLVHLVIVKVECLEFREIPKFQLF